MITLCYYWILNDSGIICHTLIEEECPLKSILIKDTTKEEREEIIRSSLDCGGGCENCSSCWLGGGSPWDIYQDYIDGKKEISEINMEYNDRYRQGRQIK